jgi:type IV secretory pathway VirB6-like protein
LCAAAIAQYYTTVKLTIYAMNVGCALGLTISAFPTPLYDAYAILKARKVALTNQNCRPYADSASIAFAAFFAELAGTYGVAVGVFNHATLCGASWTSVNANAYNISTSDYKASVENQVKEYLKNPANITDLRDERTPKFYREWYYGGAEYEDQTRETGSFDVVYVYNKIVEVNSVKSAESATNAYFKELGDLTKYNYCEDPTGNNQKGSDGRFPRQKYYLRGTETGNFNCKQYDLSINNAANTSSGTPNPHASPDDYNRAYNCCKYRSQNYVCIDFHADKATAGQEYRGGVFCKSGSNCPINDITFSAAPIDDGDSRLICAQTYSLCPYNITIGKGGTKYCDYFQDGKDGKMITPADIAAATKTDPITGEIIGTQDCNTKSEIRNSDCTFNAKAGQCRNYCQYLTHCVKVGTSDYQYQSSLDSPYFSSACFNFTGDSRNQTAYGSSSSIIGSQRHFSAPIAQCVKETLENVFYNKAGHSRCSTTNETALADGTCFSGNYLHSGNFTYKKGNQVKDVSFFSGLQNTLQTAVRMVLTLSIVFYGMKILIGNAEIKKSDLLMYVVKIGLVMFFATGNAWQGFFFDGVYNASSTFSKMVFHINSDMPDSKKDGCQFDEGTIKANPYPANKDYLSMWDTLDCKIARYLGYGPEASVANICLLILASVFTGPYGAYFAVALMFFGFFFISVTIRALHIFLSSAMSIILMIYISPIIIPMAMFDKTKTIFKQWLTNLIGFCLQPMIIFAYIAIFITVFDNTMIGSATFSGQAPQKAMSCDKICKDDNSGNPIVGGDLDCSVTGHSLVGGVCQTAAGVTVYDDPSPTCTSPNVRVGAVCRDSSGNDVGGDPTCVKAGHTMVDPFTDSIACLISVDKYAKWPGLESIGISIPMLFDLFTNHVKEKILTVVKAALVMYVLCEFVDQIPSITGQLINGTTFETKGMSAMEMMKKVGGGLDAITKRGRRGAYKYLRDSEKMLSKNEDTGDGKSADDPKKEEEGGGHSTSNQGGEEGGNDAGNEGGDSGNNTA